MAVEQLFNDIKRFVNEHWTPHRDELGLKGLIEIAARGATIAVGNQHPELIARIEELEAKVQLCGEVHPEQDVYHPGGHPLEPEGPVESATSYLCPSCNVNHQSTSGIGIEHAHLAVGG